MKKFLALLLISGYIALIPVCFFGGDHLGSVAPSAHAIGNESGTAGTSEVSADCPLDTTTCTLESGLSHHADMYASFLGFIQAQGSLFAILLLAFLPALIFIFANPLFFRLPARIFSYIKKRKEILSIYRTAYLRWLSLSINSPSYALVM